MDWDSYSEGQSQGDAHHFLVDREWYERAKAAGAVIGSVIQLTENERGEVSARFLPRPEEKMEEGVIRFKAHVWKVGTLGTGGVRIVLNLDREFIREMAILAECQHELIELQFEAKQSE